MDYKALTVEDALVLCIDLWSWMAADGTREKRYWPGWEWICGDVPFFENDCPICEYNLQNTYRCRDCIMPWSGGHCTEGEHEDWRSAKTVEEKEAASLSIVRMSEKELSKITEKHG